MNRKYGKIWEIGIGIIIAVLLLILPLLIFHSITPATEEFDKGFFWLLVGYPALAVVLVLISQIVIKLSRIYFSGRSIINKNNRLLWSVGVTMLILWFTAFLIFLFWR